MGIMGKKPCMHFVFEMPLLVHNILHSISVPPSKLENNSKVFAFM